MNYSACYFSNQFENAPFTQVPLRIWKHRLEKSYKENVYYQFKVALQLRLLFLQLEYRMTYNLQQMLFMVTHLSQKFKCLIKTLQVYLIEQEVMLILSDICCCWLYIVQNIINTNFTPNRPVSYVMQFVLICDFRDLKQQCKI
ncbi:Hypothetical_protein [Hexamita inflata]|uniref:Hypothetical_protein n=1 Tax=Hexamita inflata TaxID=28002 RepID=A0AA86N474_9EUKA|nr:Hypothetical protein HINF_LOCUS357 [Hexamita inflata]